MSDELEPVGLHVEFAFPTTEYQRQFAWPEVAPVAISRPAGVRTSRPRGRVAGGGADASSDMDSNQREYGFEDEEAVEPASSVETPRQPPRPRRRVDVGDAGQTVKKVHKFYPDEVRADFFLCIRCIQRDCVTLCAN